MAFTAVASVVTPTVVPTVVPTVLTHQNTAIATAATVLANRCCADASVFIVRTPLMLACGVEADGPIRFRLLARNLDVALALLFQQEQAEDPSR